MCDSLTVLFPIDPMSAEAYVEAKFPYAQLRPIDQDGVVTPSFSRWMTANSPLTNAKYKIRGVTSSVAGSPSRLVGYLVEINLPACLIGNNQLLVNWVRLGVRATLTLLQYWLIEQGCSRSGINALNRDRARVHSVTLTYLAQCDGVTDAHAACQELFTHAAALYNKRYRTRPLPRSPIFMVGTDEEATVYCVHRQFKIAAYVKSKSVAGTFAEYDSVTDEQNISAEAKKYLRVEIQLHKEWLRRSNMDSAIAWHYSSNKSPYDLGINLIRRYLRLNEKLRIRRPKPSQLRSLSESDQELLRTHFAGKNVGQLSMFCRENRTKYYSMRSRILAKMRIDISVPWKNQSRDLSPRLAALLSIKQQYHPPKHLAHAVFTMATVKAAIRKLDILIEDKLDQFEKEEAQVAASQKGSSLCRERVTRKALFRLGDGLVRRQTNGLQNPFFRIVVRRKPQQAWSMEPR